VSALLPEFLLFHTEIFLTASGWTSFLYCKYSIMFAFKELVQDEHRSAKLGKDR